jgi:hypothetical protein
MNKPWRISSGKTMTTGAYDKQSSGSTLRRARSETAETRQKGRAALKQGKSTATMKPRFTISFPLLRTLLP